MSILFDANNPDYNSLNYLQRLEALFRNICIETPAGVTRQVLEKNLEHISEDTLFSKFESFRKIFIFGLEEYADYGKELARLIESHTKHKFTAIEPVANITYRLDLDSELLFIKNGGDALKERANRMAFIALARALDALENLYKMVQKEYELAPAAEMFMLCAALFQATHIPLIENSLKSKRAQSVGGKKNTPKRACIKMMTELMAKHGNLSASDFLDLLQNDYPKGYKSGEYCFICVIGSQGEDAIQSRKINEPEKISIVSYKSVETYLSEARKQYQNTL